MTDSEKKFRLGMIGERIVGNYYTNSGHKVIYPIDPFDNGKDILINELKVEIKAMVPIVNDDCFDLPISQLHKIKTCDQLIFVSVPFPNNKLTHYSCGNVYAAKLNKAYFSGDYIRFKISDMRLLFTITDSNDLSYLKLYSISTY